MVTYEYLCMSCEHPFEERRSMASAVDTALKCPSCGSDRVRRRFSLFATGSPGTSRTNPAGSAGGCACGGACACSG